MLLAESRPIDWILPALLVLAWIAFWVVRRRVSGWFYVVAVLLAILCLPAGMVAGDMELKGTDCTPDNLCFSMNEVHWWINGLLASVVTVGLAFLTPFVVTGVDSWHDRRNRTPG